MFGNGQGVKIIRILRLPKFMRLLDISKFEQLLKALLHKASHRDRIKYQYFGRFIYKIFRLIIVAIVLTYFIGSLWYFIVTLTINNDQKNFFFTYNLNEKSNLDRLIICSYFTMTTLTTVGYGDFSPKTNMEKVMAIVIMIVGIGFFSYIMGSFNDVISNYELKMGSAQNKADLQRWLTSLSLLFF